MWKKVVMDGASSSDGRLKEWHGAFEAAFLAAGTPQKAALYINRDFDTNKNTLFVSPAGVRLVEIALARYNAVDCECPASEDVTLLVGHDEARDTSFADSRG